jgi:hypothetical protein
MRKASITGSTKEDAELASANTNFRRFLEVLGDDDQRIEVAKGAWLSVDPERLPDTFSVRDTRELEKCIVAELRSRLAVAECIADEVRSPSVVPNKVKAWAAPVYAPPDAETLPPYFVVEQEELPAPAKPLPSKPVRAKPMAPATITMKPAQMVLPVAEPPSTTSDGHQLALSEPITELSWRKRVTPWLAQGAAAAQLVLPAVSESERAAPSLWLRSAIFGVIERGTRQVVFQKELRTPWASRLLFSGPELDQSDLDVLLQVVHMASSQGVADRPLIFSDKAMLSALGKKYGSGNRKWLHDALSRLTSSKLSIKLGDDDERGQEVQLLLEQVWDNGRRAVTVTEGCIRLFADKRYTVFQWQARLSLQTGLAKWLHGFLMSQPTSRHGVGLNILKELSGSPASRPMKKFKTDIQQAIKEIRALNDAHLGLIEASIVDGREGPKLIYQRRPDRIKALSAAMEGT